MNILLLGGGGREHALAWKLAQSPRCKTLWATPGNPGISEVIASINARRDRSDEAGTHGLCFKTDLANHDGLIDFCQTYDIGLVVVGPEVPLVDGVADSLRTANIPVFGPSAAAARLEGSKGYTKDLCIEAGIPTAHYVRTASAAEALAALADFGLPVVIKADGLAAGKGVIIAETRAEAEAAVADMFDGSFGESGAEVVIEAFMTGEEASFFALTDGTTVVPFGSAQDHKRVGDGDTGPNTGGMGAYSPATVLTPELRTRVMDEIIRPTVTAMAARGTPYSGVLFAGLMLTPQGPKLIEYNCRFGDPECQVLMMRFDGDLVDLLLATAEGRLADVEPPIMARRAALTVVLAANGYPGTPEKGAPIALPLTSHDNVIFHAGTALSNGALVSSGGRVLSATATGDNVTQAQSAAYNLVDKIGFSGGFCRRDIGWREVAREAEKV